MDCTPALQALNSHLKQGHHRCQIEQRRSALFLRATLPERENPSRRRQQRIPLRLPATPASLPEAERLAMELGHQLRTGAFTWQGWTHESHSESAPLATVHTHAERLAARQSPTRWASIWLPALRKLPASGEITLATLLHTVEALPARSAARRDQGCVLAQIAGSLGWDANILRQAARGYTARQLTPRDIPEDGEIEVIYDRLRAPHWKWAWGMLAAYGLRPHELASLQLLETPWVLVADATKTGGRQVTACPSEWVERFALGGEPQRPWHQPAALSKALSQYLRQRGIRCPPYNLRHAYALRLMVKGVPPEYGARLMGHSLQMHEQTYKRWLDAARIKDAMRRFDL